jgi:hypothetical protein
MSDLADLMRAAGMSVEEAATNWVKAAKMLADAARARGEDESMTDDLAAWLRQQIDEDERVARAAAHGGRWRYEIGDSVGAWKLYDEHWNIASMTTYDTESYNYAERMPAFRPPTYIDPDAIGSHIARHDPARVLAEVAAKRAILELHKNIDGLCDRCYMDRAPCETVRLLAQPFAGRPGWREEWHT